MQGGLPALSFASSISAPSIASEDPEPGATLYDTGSVLAATQEARRRLSLSLGTPVPHCDPHVEPASNRCPRTKRDMLVSYKALPTVRIGASVEVSNLPQSKSLSGSQPLYKNRSRSTPYQQMNPQRYKAVVENPGRVYRAEFTEQQRLGLLLPPPKKPWIGYRYNLAKSNPVIFSPVIINENAAQRARSTFITTSRRSSQTYQSVDSALHSMTDVDASLNTGADTLRSCQEMITLSQKSRAGTPFSRVTHISQGTTSRSQSPYDSATLNFADEDAPLSGTTGYHTQRTRSLIRAQEERIRELDEMSSGQG
ncbi:hypothetical protein GMRT_10092 [Giardia muris]|uniref:Uncharacterized protein n=1 Tax=Giardia muris TaxID=5742 RepID=A0A4Z1T112_GIAMU|nr:hypothetical protein GMRT_10092 [Giardia muris]|eukprot:TNJ26209.1 hypothetical protein GMRT_10092 [Giardia muris]